MNTPDSIQSSDAPDATLAAGREFDAIALPHTFGSYVLHRLIGRGGYGDLYVGHHKRTWKDFVVKVLNDRRRGEPVSRERFALEAKIGSDLRHPHIVPVVDSGEIDGIPYLVMPFIGPDLLSVLATKSLIPKAAASLLRPIAEAVQHAHESGYFHRDIKPGNILLDPTTRKTFIGDFGLAKDIEAIKAISANSDALGTQPYMSPEQADPRLGYIAAATDVYGLGATLYHLLTGRTPFPRSDRPNREITTQIQWDRPLPPSVINNKVHPDLDRICLLCLQKSPHDRYASAAELAADLRRFEEGKPIEARLPGTTKRIYRRCQRQPVVALLIAGLLGLSLAGGTAAVLYATAAARSAIALLGAKAQTVAAQQDEAAARESERTQAYVSDMRDARLFGEKGQFAELRTILSKYGAPDRKDLRNVEWYYWQNRIGSDARQVTLDFEPTALTLSQDGNKAAVVGNDQVAVFDTLTGTRLFFSNLARSDEGGRKPPATPPRGGGTRAGVPDVLPPDGLVMAFDASGEHLAVVHRLGTDDASPGRLKAWELRTGASLITITDSRIGFGVAFSPNGQSVLTAGRGKTAWRSWDLVSGRAQGVGQYESSHSFGDDRDYTYVGRNLYFVDDRTLVSSMSSGTSVWQWAPTDAAIATGGTWHMVGGRPVACDGAVAVIAARVFGESYGFVGDNTGLLTVTLHKLSEQTRTGVPTGQILLTTPHRFRLMDCAPGVLAAQCADNILRAWTLDDRWRAGAISQEFRGAPSQCVGIAARSRVVTAIGNRTLSIWNIEPLPLERSGGAVALDALRVFGIMSPSGQLVANPRFSQRGTTIVDVKSSADNSDVSSIRLGVGTPIAGAFSPDDKYLYLSILNQTLLPTSRNDPRGPARDEIWELAGPRLVASVPVVSSSGKNNQEEGDVEQTSGGSMANGVNSVSNAVAFDGERSVAYVIANQQVYRIDLGTGATEANDLPFVANSITVSPGGRYLALTGRKCGIYSILDRKWLWINATTSTRAVFHKTGKYVVVQAMEKGVSPVVLATDSGKPWAALFMPREKARYVLSTDGRRVFEVAPNGLSVYTIDENPGTLVLYDSNVRLPESEKLDVAYIRTLEQQLTGYPISTP